MKAFNHLRKFVMAGALVLALTKTVIAQPIPPFGTNQPPNGGGTNIDASPYFNLSPETFSNNLASVSDWIHESINNADGTPADSFQNLMESQITTFAATSDGTTSWQQSRRDEAMSWATAVGVPTSIQLIDGTTATLAGREDNVPFYLAPCDTAAATTINTTNVWPAGSTGFNLTGTNTTISQWDEASPRLTHSEFSSRVVELDGVATLSDHSTAVAGILAATGANIVFSNGVPLGTAAKGMSYQAQVQARDFNGDLGEMTAAVGTNHMRLSNHSYEFRAGWFQDSLGQWYWLGNAEISTNQDPKFGNYTTNTAPLDSIAIGAPTYLQVWAAGNEQAFGPPVQKTNHFEFTLAGTVIVTNGIRGLDGDAGGYDSLSQQAVAKDILTVGAVNPLGGFTTATNVILASFSSLGPTDDGRIKPDVVADGVNNIIALSSSDFAYGQGSGTSFAAPSVAGSINLLTQFYKQLHTNSAELLSSTVKGLVIHTADSCTTNTGPSYRFGWGLMNTKAAATLLNQDATNGLKNQIKEVLLPNGQFIQFPVVSAGNTNSPLKVTICWTDPAGTPNSATNLNNPTPKLVNDLDLRVFAPNGTTNLPWVLNPDLTNRTSTARSAIATKGDDSRNNVEQIYIPSPTNGTYTIKVTHKGNLQSNSVQWVSILISGNVPQPTPQLKLSAPLPVATNQVAVGWASVVGQNYQLQANNNLTTTNWTTVGGIINARLTNIVALATTSSNQMQFYRVVQLQ